MGIEYSVEVAYGFVQKKEDASVLLQKLGSDEEFLDGTERELLTGLGYQGLAITEGSPNSDRGGWAIFADATHRDISPRYEEGIWNLKEPSKEVVKELKRLRDQLFPKLSWEEKKQPKLGWFLISSAY